MTDLNLYILLLFACIASAAITWLISANQGKVIRSDLIKEKQSNEHNSQTIRSLEGSIVEKNTDLANLREELNQKNRDVTRLQTVLEQKEIGFESKLQTEFENISNRIFAEKGQVFTANNKTELDTILEPFKTQLTGFQTRVNEVHTASVEQNASLLTQIQSITEEANSLASALKGDSQMRGAWGEAQLEATLQFSGLIEETHYKSQESFRDPEGRAKRTDYVVILPDKKNIVIDSKVSLVDYDDLVSANSDEEAKIALDRHVKAVKSHIDDLADKDYTNLVGIDSPSFVLMFMPLEPAYIEALKYGKDLFGYGYEKNVIMVSHTTLVPILRTVSNLWMLHQSNKEAKKLGDKAQDIYNQVCTVVEKTKKVGTSLTAAQNNYNELVGSLVGQRGLRPKVERFSQLSSRASKKLEPLDPINVSEEDQRLKSIPEKTDD